MLPDKGLKNHIEISHYWLNRLGYSWRGGELYDNDWRFYLNLDEGAYITFHNIKIYLEKERFYLIPPLTPITCQVVSGNNPRQFFIHFKTGHPHNSISRGVYSFEISNEIDKLYRLILEDLEQTHRKGSYKGILHCLTLISLALGKFSEKDFSHELRDKRIVDIIKTMEKDMTFSPSSEYLASLSGLSVNGMIQLFKKEVGCTPYRYLTQKRVEKAQHLMEDSHLSLEEISERCGYCDRFQFSKTFKKIMNCTPGEYRKRPLL